MRHDALGGMLLWWNCQSPVVHSCGLLNPLNGFCRGKFKLNAKFYAESLLCSLSNFECDGHTVHSSCNGIYHPHWLAQWSHHFSHICIPVCSLWMPVTSMLQTILITWTMVEHFPQRPHICSLTNPITFFQSVPTSSHPSYSCQSLPWFSASDSICSLDYFLH